MTEMQSPRNSQELAAGQETNIEFRNRAFVELRDVDLGNDAHFNQLLDLIRLEPHFREFPECRDQDPELYDRLRGFLQDCVREGSITLYDNGVNIHEHKPGQMQVLLSGELQMTQTRYSRKIPELEQLGFDGPKFGPGMALASWSMAGNTGSHFGELYALGPVLTFAMSPVQYEKLILLSKDSPYFRSAERLIDEADVKELIAAGLIRSTSGSDNCFTIIRPRDLRTLLRSGDLRAGSEAFKIWESRNLAEQDFVIQEAGAWRLVQHAFQQRIKENTIAQHVLEKNFLAKSLSERAPIFENDLNHKEKLALAANIRFLTHKEVQLRPEQADMIFLVIHDSSDLEYPEKVSQASGRIEALFVEEKDGQEQSRLFEIAVPAHGVIDWHQIKHELVEGGQLSTNAELRTLTIQCEENQIICRADLKAYRNQLSASSGYSIEDALQSMRRLGLEPQTGVADSIRTLFEESLQRIEKGQRYEQRLSLEHKEKLLSIMYSWIQRTTMDRRGADRLPVTSDHVHELSKLFSFYEVEWQRRREHGPESIMPIPLPYSADRVTAKILLIVKSHFEPQTLAELQEQSLSEFYYRDVKHTLNVGIAADQQLRERQTAGYQISAVESVRVPWARHHPRDLIFIPDRHEDLFGLEHEMRALGVMDLQGKIRVEALGGRELLFQGDIINRQVSNLGYGALRLVDSTIEAVRNVYMKSGADQQDAQASMLLGNHERDLLTLSEADLQAQFPEFTGYLIARETRAKIERMISEGKICAAVYLGDREKTDIPESHALATHAGILPGFRSELRAGHGVSDDLNLVEHLNSALRQAVREGDFSHPLFAKSHLRGGNQSFSGPIEADMGEKSYSDFSAEVQKLIEQGFSAQQIEREFGYQVVGHSFNSALPEIRVFSCETGMGAISIPGCIITDLGDHQAFGTDPTRRIGSFIVHSEASSLRPEKEQARFFQPTYKPAPPLISSEEEVYEVSKNSEHPYLQGLRNFKQTDESFVPYLQANHP